MTLSKTSRRWLAKKAQKLKPAVMIGKDGVSDAAAAQTRAELEIRELVKVKFIGTAKEESESLASLLAERSEAVLVRRLGHTAVLYKPREDPEERKIHPPA